MPVSHIHPLFPSLDHKTILPCLGYRNGSLTDSHEARMILCKHKPKSNQPRQSKLLSTAVNTLLFQVPLLPPAFLSDHSGVARVASVLKAQSVLSCALAVHSFQNTFPWQSGHIFIPWRSIFKMLAPQKDLSKVALSVIISYKARCLLLSNYLQ